MSGARVLGVVGSLAVHTAALAMGVLLMVPGPLPEQALPDSRLSLATMRVLQRDAHAAEPQAQEVAEVTATGLRASGQGIVQRRARAVAFTSATLRARLAPGEVHSGKALNAGRVDAVSTGALTVASALLPSREASASGLSMRVAQTIARPGTQVEERLPAPVEAVAVRFAPSAVLSAMPPAVNLAAAVTSEPRAASVVAAPSVMLAGVQTSGPPQGAETHNTPATAARAPDAPVIGAALDWSGAGALDAHSLNTVAAFLRPGTAEGREMREGLAATLAAPECARIQTAFDQESGGITLHGHVRDESQRAPLLAALTQQLGASLPLDDQLLVLPAPQCVVLTALDRVGLPQSEEQFTDPMVVGNTTQAQIHSFREGEAFELRLNNADYPAYVYVDYFDGAGDVIHLIPSAPRALEKLPPGAELKIGERDLSVPLRPPLDLRIAAPFGQDIAVAFAASQPLYDGLRPFSEDAGSYLAFLTERIAVLRTTAPDFRGEWAYLFVITRPVRQ